MGGDVDAVGGEAGADQVGGGGGRRDDHGRRLATRQVEAPPVERHAPGRQQLGRRSKTRSWTVTTSGRRPGGGTARLVACTTSPGTRTTGRRRRCHAS